MDWSEKDLCIKCNEGGNLLICSENGCPLAVHEGCMGCPARYDDSGRFYCPYCWYKQAVGEACRAREYALERKKALLLFMDEKTISSEQQVEEIKIAEDNGRNESKTSEGNVNITACNDGKSKANSDAILNGPIQHEEKQKTGNAEEDTVQEEESEASAGFKCRNPSLELHEEQRTSNEGKKNHEEEHETSAASSGEDPSRNMHGHSISGNEGKKIQEEESETISDSTGEDPSLTLHARAKRGSKRRKQIDWDSDTVLAPSKLRKQLNKNKQTSPIVDATRRSSRRSSSAPKNEVVSNEVVAASKNSTRSKQSPVKLTRDTFGNGKRKRLFWTEEEEEMIRVGVKKYSKEAKIPWRKILDEGSHTFNATRTPGDLKDKWRNMSAK